MGRKSLEAVYMRGGTSRALFFDRNDLPSIASGGDTAAWDEIFCRALGSPDPNRRQLDGMGGGITSLSKVAVIGRPTHPDADVDYTFAQVDVTSPVVGYRGNCGNISSAVGPYAIDRGLVAAQGNRASIVIHNTNTKKLIRASFDLEGGLLADHGDLA
jgi:2-methylaconitate isomerase